MPRPKFTAFISKTHTRVPCSHQTPTHRHNFFITQHTHLESYHIPLHLTTTMSLPRGGSRFFKAARSAVAWPTRVKVAPFSTPDIEQIPFWENGRLMTTFPRWKTESDLADAWSKRWSALLVDREDNTLDQPGMFLFECCILASVYFFA